MMTNRDNLAPTVHNTIDAATGDTLAAMDELLAVLRAGAIGDLIRMDNCLDAASYFLDHARQAVVAARVAQGV